VTPNAEVSRSSTTSPGDSNTNPNRVRLHLAPVSHVEDAKSPDRLPPHDVDLEQALLAAVVLHSDWVGPDGVSLVDAVVATGLQPEHLYVPGHGRVWAAILELHAQGAAVDVHTVSGRCRDRNDVLGLLQAQESTVRTPAPVWALLVIEYARCRSVLPLIEAALDELLAGRLKEVRLLLTEATEVLAA
jgi:hypothetical protein